MGWVYLIGEVDEWVFKGNLKQTIFQYIPVVHCPINSNSKRAKKANSHGKTNAILGASAYLMYTLLPLFSVAKTGNRQGV